MVQTIFGLLLLIFHVEKLAAFESLSISQAFYKTWHVSNALVLYLSLIITHALPLCMWTFCASYYACKLYIKMWCCFYCTFSNKLILIQPTSLMLPALKLGLNKQIIPIHLIFLQFHIFAANNQYLICLQKRLYSFNHHPNYNYQRLCLLFHKANTGVPRYSWF